MSSTPVFFDTRGAERINRAVRAVEANPVLLNAGRSVPLMAWAMPIRYGKPTSAFSSGTTVTLDPCTIDGTDTGEDNATVYLKPDQSSFSMSFSTTIPDTMIVPFTLGADGDWYVVGTPIVVAVITDEPDEDGCYPVKAQVIWPLFAGTLEA